MGELMIRYQLQLLNLPSIENYHLLPISDKVPPVFTSCPGNVIKKTEMPSETVFWPKPIAEDNSLVVTVAGSHVPNAAFDIGITEVNYTASDESGNTEECRFFVTVILGMDDS